MCPRTSSTSTNHQHLAMLRTSGQSKQSSLSRQTARRRQQTHHRQVSSCGSTRTPHGHHLPTSPTTSAAMRKSTPRQRAPPMAHTPQPPLSLHSKQKTRSRPRFSGRATTSFLRWSVKSTHTHTRTRTRTDGSKVQPRWYSVLSAVGNCVSF